MQDTQSQNVDVWESEPTLHHNQGNLSPSWVCFPRNKSSIKERKEFSQDWQYLSVDSTDTIVKHV
ncbi:Uncharacterised protein [Streptococcus pneumoniae]|nr:Uncharacterised protein [Streptococcus pneumoniae]